MSSVKAPEGAREARTHQCCKTGGRLVVRGEIPNERGDSLFSPKSLEGERSRATAGGRALDGGGGGLLTEPNQTPNAGSEARAVGRREMSFVVERERAQSHG